MSRIELVTPIDTIPAELRDRILGSLRDADQGRQVIDDEVAPSPARLADAALGLIRDVLDSEGDRGVALDLLAADALLTEACAAAASFDVESRAEFTRGLIDQLAELVTDD